MQTSTADRIRATVREAYGAVATQKQQGGCCGGGAAVDVIMSNCVINLARSQERVESSATSQVEHPLAGFESRDGLRVPAAEPEVGAVGHGGHVGIRVAQARR